jgi:hypothetical protein
VLQPERREEFGIFSIERALSALMRAFLKKSEGNNPVQ